LHHRIQNLFTVIQAVIRFSLPGEGMVLESAVKQRLMDRLQSMSTTNRAITDSMGDGVRLKDLISSEIKVSSRGSRSAALPASCSVRK
jgi:two-component sensor histidine kinase